MIISASIQAADQLNILQSIQQHSSEFDQIHVDITDGHFTNNISMSFSHIKEVKNQTYLSRIKVIVGMLNNYH